MRRITGQSRVGEPKTPPHSPDLDSPDYVAMLQEFPWWQCQIGLDYPDDYFLRGANPDALRMRFDRLAAKVGVERRLHDLRHCVATNMLAQGAAVATMARRLGHPTPRVNLRVMPTPPRQRTARLRV